MPRISLSKSIPLRSIFLSITYVAHDTVDSRFSDLSATHNKINFPSAFNYYFLILFCVTTDSFLKAFQAFTYCLLKATSSSTYHLIPKPKLDILDFCYATSLSEFYVLFQYLLLHTDLPQT